MEVRSVLEPTATGLRAFLKVAEELHFGRAARALYLTTPALSQQIARLEKSLETSLFDRSSRQVELTATGSELVPLARDVVASLDRVNTWKRRRGQPVLRIGFHDVGPWELTTRIFAAVAEDYPDLEMDFAYVHRDEAAQELLSGNLDVVFLWDPLAAGGVRTHTLTTQPRVLLLSEGHELATRDELTVEDLALVSLLEPDSSDPAYIAWFMIDPRPDGSRARAGHRVRNLQEALAFVAMGAGAFLVPSDVAAAVHHPLVTQKVVTDAPESPFAVSLLVERVSPVIDQFMRVVADVSQTFTETSGTSTDS
jgi:DNA-binding transcriptional LysR family regulator